MEILTIIKTGIGDKLASLLENFLNDIEDEVKHVINNQILEYQVEEYQRNSCSKTLLHRVQPKLLKEFYQPLFITPLKKSGFSSKRITGNRKSTESIKEIFEKTNLVTIIGNAGSGKSTIVKYLFLNSIDEKYKIPIKVELRYLNEFEGDLFTYVKDKIFKLSKLAKSERIIERLLESGKFVFFFDGYDEVSSSKKEDVAKSIDNFVKVYSKNSYLLTTRPYTQLDLIPLFHNFQVCDLTDKEINEFIQKQIPESDKELCNKIIEAVNSKQNNSYKSFLQNPLLLSMFILTFQSYSNIPEKRSEFYRQVFDTLFSLHDSMSKLAYVREKESGLSKDQFIEVLKLFSFISFFEEQFIFSGHYLDDKLNLIKSKKKNLKFDNERLRADLQIAIGIMNKEGIDYTFPHRSLQEYFAALYIATLGNQNKKIIYKKIQKSLKVKKSGPIASKENFYQLLSELDEKGVVEFILIPFLKDITKNMVVDESNPRKTIDTFVNLNSFFNAFATILKNDDFRNFDRHLSKEFQKIRLHYKKINKEKDSEENVSNLARTDLTKQEIIPFLNSYKPNLEEISVALEEFLKEENESDNDIISMI